MANNPLKSSSRIGLVCCIIAIIIFAFFGRTIQRSPLGEMIKYVPLFSSLLFLTLFLHFEKNWAKTGITREISNLKGLLMLVFLIATFIFLLTFGEFYPLEEVHILVFGLIGLFLPLSFSLPLWAYGFIVFGLGTAEEVLQYFIPDRVFDFRDILNSGTSGVIGVGLSRVFFPIQRAKTD